MKIPFVGPSYQMDSRSFDFQRSINLYPLMSESGTSKSVTALRTTPGLSLYVTAGNGPCRGNISSTSGRAFVVSGDNFIEIKTDGTTETHGQLNTIVGTVSIAENNTQIMVVDGTDGWIFTLATDTWSQITDPQFPTCSVVSYQDGYFLVTEDDTQKFWISNLNDGTAWDALDYTTVESSPDDLIAVQSEGGNVWLFGNRSLEVYQNVPVGTDFPFQRIPGAIIPTGCAAKFSIQKFDNSLVWLGVDEDGKAIVWKTQGYQATRISTQAIEKRIRSSSQLEDSYSWVYHQDGHIFYVLQIPGLDTSLVYDGTTQQWHERAYRDTDTGDYELHRGACHMFFNNKNLVCDRENGKVYELSLSVYSDNGDPMIRERISPHIQDEKKYINVNSFELDVEQAVGLTSGQGSDPMMMMSYSHDGGNTWSSELWESLGAKGNYNTRVRWRQLGVGRDRVWKVKVSDPVFVQINEAYINAT